MKIISWNVNGIRAASKKGFEESMKKQNADIICLQETKINEKHPVLLDYEQIWSFAEKKGYSGTAIFTKEKPLNIEKDFLHNGPASNEGRMISLEFKEFYLVNVYIPNSGRGLVRLEYRAQWDKDFLTYLKNLEKKKPVILCGDLNVAHKEIDLANPKSNYNKTAGYTQKEIDGMNNLQENFIDTFREFNKEPEQYTWWSYMFNARAKNIGWRIDYFLISKKLKSRLKNAFILPEILGSDHCPVGIELK
ncbi:exodeoxyribonuclease III [Candidatus Woesearchaeota archaeon]|nr:exodeoxyribonuclease III [Candidatus Woesearchaeota archaeon]MCF7900938.1 exodeoxyribonuclease III [Candidatus Woesearchaeota archaeon]MCF8012864.1 exodeoxyribonuclease III [Candidatus Woesearchaeota archaeon]